jgi:hypothetical protein
MQAALQSRTVATSRTELPINDNNISWKSDRTKKFGSQKAHNFNTDAATRGGGTITGECSVRMQSCICTADVRT